MARQAVFRIWRGDASGGKFQDLNKLIPAKSGWVLIEANGINNAGQITGMGMHKGLEHAFLLTPH